MTVDEGTNVQSLPAIEMRHVSLSFQEVSALREISFALPQGEMWIVTGASGSGKSALLKVAIGLVRPDAGQVFINGREIENLSETELLRIRGNSMGIVFQEEALFTGLTVFDNVAYRLVEHGVAEEEIQKNVEEVLRFVGMDQEMEKFPEELSGGMKRRLEFARAIIGYPPIMLFDEPTSGLDPINAGQMLDLIIRARDTHNITALYVTKAMHEIYYLASHKALNNSANQIEIVETHPGEINMKVLLLDRGQIAWTGTSEEFHHSGLPVVTYLTHAGAHEIHSKHELIDKEKQ